MKIAAFSFLICLSFVTSLYAEGNITRGEVLSARCVTCHGFKGVSSNPLWPNLSGQHAPYLIKQLQDFKSGKRENALMKAIASGLSQQDIEDLAVYFNSIKVRIF